MIINSVFALCRSIFMAALLVTHFNAAGATSLTVEDFLVESSLKDVKLSPNGQYLALLRNIDKTRIVEIRDIQKPGFPVTGLIRQEFIRATAINWANDDRLLVDMDVPFKLDKVKRDAKKKDDFNIYNYPTFTRIISMDTQAKDFVILLENKKQAIRQNHNRGSISNFLIDDYKHVQIITGSRHYHDKELHKVNIYTGESKLIARFGERTYKILSDKSGKLKYKLDYLRLAKTVEVYKYTEQGTWEHTDDLVYHPEEPDGIRVEGLVHTYFGMDENNELVYLEQNPESGFDELVLIDRKSGNRRLLASVPDQDIDSVIMANDTNEIKGYTVKKDLTRSYYFDEIAQQRYDAIEHKIREYDFIVNWSRNSDMAVVKSFGMDNPGIFYLYNAKTDTLSLIQSAFTNLTTENLSIPAQATYKARDGTKIRLYILLPVGFSKLSPAPLIVMPHGGPHVRDSATYDQFAQLMSTRGYIVIKPNFRGSKGYGKAFEEAGYKQWGNVMQDDVTDAVNFMIDESYADPEKVCIVGGSYGGYAALMGVIKTPDLYKCAVSINGVTDLTKQIEFDIKVAGSRKNEIRELVYRQIGHPSKDAKYLAEYSPLLRVQDIHSPMLIVAGTDDKIVPFSQSEKLVSALKKLGKEHRFIELEHTGHNAFYYKDDREKIFEEVTTFLEKHLK